MGKDESSRETTATAVVGDLPDATLLERVATQRDEGARVTWRGIYQLKGDRLLLCWNTEGRERPADFTGERFYYYDLRRQPERQR